MRTFLLTLTALFVGLVRFIAWAADDLPILPTKIADLSVCSLNYGGYGQCISALGYSQVDSSPAWDISAGAPPLLPEKAEAIAKETIAAFVAPYAAIPIPYLSEQKPLLFSYQRTRLIKHDAAHWYYGIEFKQRPAGGATGSWPTIEIFVTFDGQVGSLRLVSPPK